MKLPDGYVAEFKSVRNGTAIQVFEKELVKCKNCRSCRPQMNHGWCERFQSNIGLEDWCSKGVKDDSL